MSIGFPSKVRRLIEGKSETRNLGRVASYPSREREQDKRLAADLVLCHHQVGQRCAAFNIRKTAKIVRRRGRREREEQGCAERRAGARGGDD
eukprot:746911-Hanusia_phi.AAC.7